MARIHNFHVIADVHSRKRVVSIGTKGKEDSFDLTIYVRHKGEIRNVVNVLGRVRDFGKTLVLKVDGTNGYNFIQDHAKGEFTIITER